MNKGRVLEKEGSHRRQSLREARVSQTARPHRSQGLTEGQVSQMVSHKGTASQKTETIKQRQSLTERQGIIK